MRGFARARPPANERRQEVQEQHRGAEVLRAYRYVMESADDDLGGCAVLHQAPPAPFVPADLVGKPVVSLMVTAFGDLDRAEELVAPLRALGPIG